MNFIRCATGQNTYLAIFRGGTKRLGSNKMFEFYFNSKQLNGIVLATVDLFKLSKDFYSK